MKQRKSSGRPADSSPHKSVDDPLIERAVQLIAAGQAQNPTDAFKQLVEDEDSVHIRRLQRRWRQVGDQVARNHVDVLRQDRWRLESEALRHSAPDLHARVTAFANSPAGATLLEHIAGRPLPPMAFGIARLWELVQSTSPHGAAAADAAFTDALTHWSRFGAAPDRTFLLRFAELCREQAVASEGEGG